jgi:hypothetical protein
VPGSTSNPDTFKRDLSRPAGLADALRLARSVNPLLRHRAARQPDLPAANLADDSDPGVRRLLALTNPEAPPGP